MATDIETLRRRVAEFDANVAAQRARLEQANLQIANCEMQIANEFHVEPKKLAESLASVEAEIQTLTSQIHTLLQN